MGINWSFTIKAVCPFTTVVFQLLKYPSDNMWDIKPWIIFTVERFSRWDELAKNPQSKFYEKKKERKKIMSFFCIAIIDNRYLLCKNCIDKFLLQHIHMYKSIVKKYSPISFSFFKLNKIINVSRKALQPPWIRSVIFHWIHT